MRSVGDSRYFHHIPGFTLLLSSLALGMAANIKDATRGNSNFAVNLYQKSIEGNDGKNIILSPLSIQTAVALAYMGAGGQTAEEMSVGLGFTGLDKQTVASKFHTLIESYRSSPMIKLANKIFVKTGYEIATEFNQLATEQFRSEAEVLEFSDNVAAASTINHWVEEKTNDKIHDLIKADSLDDNTRMVLVNAIYFKGDWANKFPKEATHEADFYTSETDSVKVDMMTVRKHFKYGEFSELDATAIELPYKDSDLSMLIILPNSRTGLPELERKLNDMNFADIGSKMFDQEVILSLPKFKIEFEIKLNDVLKKMGMTTMFEDNADFSHLLKSSEPLKISEVVHKAFIEVNEEGAEAAAATGVIMMARCVRICPNFVADHPFIYFIWNREQCCAYFTGRFSK